MKQTSSIFPNGILFTLVLFEGALDTAQPKVTKPTDRNVAAMFCVCINQNPIVMNDRALCLACNRSLVYRNRSTLVFFRFNLCDWRGSGWYICEIVYEELVKRRLMQIHIKVHYRKIS